MAHELDVRGLPPPEPFEHIMRALSALPAGAYLHVHIDREPYPLYKVLRDSGYAWQTTALTDGSFSIRIRHNA
ncbi:MAG: DUF2249 domain-containing protein [Gallionella sp.]|jgi:uncharacterized protein (DUF2249 family)